MGISLHNTGRTNIHVQLDTTLLLRRGSCNRELFTKLARVRGPLHKTSISIQDCCSETRAVDTVNSAHQDQGKSLTIFRTSVLQTESLTSIRHCCPNSEL